LAELEAAAESDARMTPEAMAELLDLLVEEGRPVGEDTLELARALRFEHGGSRGLLLAEARALTAGERFEEALALLDGERATAPGEDLDRALAATVAALTERLEDAPFLELALSGLPEALPLDARETVARRLSALGFPDEAWALRNATGPALPGSSVPALDPAAWVPRPENPAPPLSVPEPPVPVAEAQAASPTSPPLSLLSAEPMEQAEASAAALGVAGPLPGPVPPALVAAAPAPPTAVAAMPAVPPSAEVVVPEAPPPFVVEEAGDASAILVPPVPAPLADATGSGMTLAQRRALLAQAEDVRARAAALLGQELGQ
jgi:hypothetical protein